MNKRELLDDLLNRYVLFSCEEGAESIIVKRLVESDRLVVPWKRIVEDPLMFEPYTRCRKADDIAQRFFGMDFAVDGAAGLAVARIVDSRAGKFSFSKKWENGTKMLNFYTRPEIEMLVIQREVAADELTRAHRRNRQLRPKEFCKQYLKMPNIEAVSFLEGYWADSNSVVESCKLYEKSLGKRQSDELCIADLVA